MADLTFDEASHTYRLDGRVVPSVTQVLDPLYDFSRIAPEVLERKRNLGTAVHKAIELDVADDLDHASLSEAVLPYFQAWQQFNADFAPRNAQSEVRVYSKHGYAGTCDLVCEQRDEVWVLDFKTSAEVGAATALQTAAYSQAVKETWRPNDDLQHLFRRGAVHLKPDGTYKLHTYNDRTDWPTFLACLTLHNWRMNNGL